MKKGAFASLVVAIFVSGAVAGCLGDGAKSSDRAGTKNIAGAPPKVWDMADSILSQPIFDKILFEGLPLTATDGTFLDSWMYRPETPDDVKVPAILHLSPYYGSSLPAGGGGMLRMMNENYTARGYAVIGHSVRGTGFSGGCFEIGGPRERQDVVELVNHIANQSWSNGNVGLIGVSYDGTAPQGALIMSNPHIRTIVPIAAISEWYKYNFVKGVQINPQGYAFNTYYVGDEGAPNVHGLPHVGPLSTNPNAFLALISRPPQMSDIEMWPSDGQILASRACPNQGGNNGAFRGGSLIDPQRAQFATAFTGTTDPYWEERNFTKHIENIRPNVSVLVVHGLLDFNVKTHNLLPWYTELKEFGVPTKILLGQWPHAYPGTTRPNGRADWNLTLLRWWDHWLKGIDTGIMEEPEADIQDFHGVWRTEEAWPPSRAVDQKFYFDASGQLKDAPGSGQSQFIDNGDAYDPAAASNPNAVMFLGPVLEEEFRYSGEATAVVSLSHAAPRGQIAITVYNVTGDVWQPINYGFYNYNIRNDPATYDLVDADERFTLTIPLLPTDMVVTAGSRLAIVAAGISTGACTGENAPERCGGGPSMLPPPSGGTTTMFHGEASYISFPTLDGITPTCPQPEMTGRDANQVC